MNKKLILLIIILTFSLTACTKEKVETENIKNVSIITVKESTMEKTIHYFGFIEPSEIKSFSIKNGGKVEKIFVEVGQSITENTPLIKLDTYEYNLSLNASSEQLKLAKLELEKAKKSYDFYKKLYNDTLDLYNNNAISKQKLDEIKLSYDINETQYNQAKKNYNKAKIDLEYKTNTKNESTLFSDMNGKIIDILKKEGEIYIPPYPIILARSNENIVKIGVSEKDIKKLFLNQIAKIKIENKIYSGEITKINLMPDKESKTYNVEITIMSEGDFLIGQSCDVIFETDKTNGIWLPITYIMNDGEDYVYVVINNRAIRRNINLSEINSSYVMVQNLKEGEKIIVKGKNSIYEGVKVNIVSEENVGETNE